MQDNDVKQVRESLRQAGYLLDRIGSTSRRQSEQIESMQRELRKARERIAELENSEHDYDAGYAQGKIDAANELTGIQNNQGLCICGRGVAHWRCDPFRSEIHGDYTPVLMCDECAYDSAREI